MKKWWGKYSHALVLLYMPIYGVWFTLLERHITPAYWMHCRLDDWIPFNEWFLIPYLMWFLYVAGVMGFFFFRSREDFLQLSKSLCVGMTICLALYTLFPNGQNLRPDVLPRDNFMSRLVLQLYGVDTSTNVCPSIHVLNSIAVHLALCHSPLLRGHRGVKIASGVLAVAIMLSTLFLKQHSAVDALAAFCLAVPLYLLFYVLPDRRAAQQSPSAPAEKPVSAGEER